MQRSTYPDKISSSEEINLSISIPKYLVPLSFGKEYHLGFIYHASSLDWVKITTTKLEQEQNLICYFRDRNGLPGDRKPELDPEGHFFRKVMNFVVVLNNQFLNDRPCMKLLSLAKRTSLEDQRCNILPVLLDDCEIPFSFCDTTIVEVQESGENEWFNRLLRALQLDERLLDDIMELEKAANSLVEAFESEELREVLHSLGNPSARKIDLCLTQGRSSKVYQGLKFLATDKWFQTLSVCHPSDMSMITRIIKSLNNTASQPLQDYMIEQLYLDLPDCPAQGSFDFEYNDFDGEPRTLWSKKGSHISISELTRDLKKPNWNRALNVVIVLSKISIRDRSFLRKVNQIIMAHDEAPDDESFRIIPLKIDDCEVPDNLRDVFDVEILDGKEEYITKFYHAINNTVDSDKFYFRENDKRNKTESSLKTLSSVLAKTPDNQLSDFLSKPVATKLRHYFAEYGEFRYWKLAMESCGITLSGRTVVIRLKPLIRHLCLGHVVGKYYDYCQSVSGENMIKQEIDSSVKNMSYDNVSLVIESYGSQPCDSFVIGLGLQHALQFSYKTTYNLIRQWHKGTSCNFSECSISIFRCRKHGDNRREMRENAYTLLRQVLLSIKTDQFRFFPIGCLKRYGINGSFERDFNFESDKRHNVESIATDTWISNPVKGKEFDELTYKDSEIKLSRPGICMAKDKTIEDYQVNCTPDDVKSHSNRLMNAEDELIYYANKNRETRKTQECQISESILIENSCEYLRNEIASLTRDLDSFDDKLMSNSSLLRSDIKLLNDCTKVLLESNESYTSLQETVMLYRSYVHFVRQYVQSLSKAENYDPTRFFRITLF